MGWDGWVPAAVVLSLVSLGAIPGCVIGVGIGQDSYKRCGTLEIKAEAVQRGYAEWYLDERGESTWRWKTTVKESK